MIIDSFLLVGKSYRAKRRKIRKKIQKEEGDTVKLILYPDEAQMVIPEHFLVCLREEPKLYKHFEKFSEKRKKEMTDWIFAAKTGDEKITGIAKTLEKLEGEIGSK